MISSGTTVREVALQLPEATRLFEKLNIDYCCGGNRALSDACASAGVETADVLRMLDAVAPPTAHIRSKEEQTPSARSGDWRERAGACADRHRWQGHGNN